MKKIAFLFIIVCAMSDFAFSQGEIDTQKTIFYRNERSWGMYLNTNGFGANYRHGKHVNASIKRVYEIDCDIIKDPKEYKKTNPYRPDSNRFAYGKLNTVFDVRYGFGWQKEIYRKIDKGGVAIKTYYLGGPTLCLLKPIYYEIIDKDATHSEKFDIDKYSPQDILGTSSFFKGITETQFVPGGFLKFGLSFEYSKKDNQIRALEGGIMVQGFAKKIQIMANNTDRQFLVSLFLCYRFGSIYSEGHLSNVDGVDKTQQPTEKK